MTTTELRVPLLVALLVSALHTALNVAAPRAQASADQLVQWGFVALVPGYTDIRITNAHRMLAYANRNMEAMPFVVPPGFCLGITGAKLSQKFGHSSVLGTERSSYFVLSNLDTITDSQGMMSYPQPLVLPSGFIFGDGVHDIHIINNAVEQQWMNAHIFGVLRACSAFTNDEAYRHVFNDWFRRP